LGKLNHAAFIMQPDKIVRVEWLVAQHL